ncbi:MAG: DNA methyltransferase, partial [Porticoccus sp.]
QPFSVIKLSQFYGIELDDFAHEVAILSLWLAEHQMNVEFKAEFGESYPSLPLQKSGCIVCGNATRLDWNDICPASNSDEVYVLGNPPYLGFKMQGKEQKSDIESVFKGIKNYKKLDYISCWIFIASKYVTGKAGRFAFVSTNSICQGEHVGLLWPHIFDLNLEIEFAHKSFKWKNSAKDNAGVICVIVGVGDKSSKDKYLYSEDKRRTVKSINAYLSPDSGSVVMKRSAPISWLPKMNLGNMPKDDGNFILTEAERDQLISDYPQSEKFIRKLIGAFEFIRGTVRWCIWITDETLAEAIAIPPIKERISKVEAFRASSTDKSANKMALTPHKFREQNLAKKNSVIIPTVTSERRDYIPMGFLDKDTIIVAPNNALYDPPVEVFAIISSRMHMTWVRAVAGRLKTDYRYSSVLCYNTFPFPEINDVTREGLSNLVFALLAVQQSYAEKTIADLYDPVKMPQDLRLAHTAIDTAVEKCYRNNIFSTDEERLEFLFKEYERITGGQNA